MGNYAITESTVPVEFDEAVQRSRLECWQVQWLFPLRDAGFSELKPGHTLSVGREPGCDVLLLGRQASRVHCKFECTDDELVVVDLKSRNGTFVNGKRVKRANLGQGDVVRVGDRLGVLRRGHEGESREPSVQLVAQGLWAGPELRAAVDVARRLATTNLPIVIQGETGTGKERVARAIHEWSQRSGRFVGINCAAIPESLAEAELFGHRKGAFSGADRARAGLLQAADGGTLLLDEVCDLPLPLQAKLLRVLEEKEVQRIGDTEPTSIDVRIVTAARVSLAELVEQGRCRRDFAARLSGATVLLPRLRERSEELPSLFVQLLRNHLRSEPPDIEAVLMEQLLLHDWPGNIRELDLLGRRLLGLYGHEGRLHAAHLAGVGFKQSLAEETLENGLGRDERDIKRLLAALKQHRGNLAKAASAVSVSRQRAYRLLQGAALDLGELRKEPG